MPELTVMLTLWSVMAAQQTRVVVSLTRGIARHRGGGCRPRSAAWPGNAVSRFRYTSVFFYTNNNVYKIESFSRETGFLRVSEWMVVYYSRS